MERRGKRKLYVMVDEELYRELIELAPRIYGRHFGALSAIVEEALKEYLERKKRELEKKPS